MILIHSQLISVNGKLIQIDELLMQKMIFQVRPILPLGGFSKTCVSFLFNKKSSEGGLHISPISLLRQG